jgi:hypothetical protein
MRSPIQTPFGFFAPEETKQWILPITKISRPIRLPDWVGEELGRTGTSRPFDSSFHLSIDLGTTKSTAAYINAESAIEFVRDIKDRFLIPSTVFLFFFMQMGITRLELTTLPILMLGIQNER